MRLGYGLGHASAIRLLSRVKVPWNVPSVTLAAASVLLDDAIGFDARLKEFRVLREDLAGQLARLPGVEVLPSEGNFVLLDVSRTRLSVDSLVEALLAEGLLIRSLKSHHANRSFVRVTVGRREDNERCVRAFDELLKPSSLRRRRLEVGVPAYLTGDAE